MNMCCGDNTTSAFSDTNPYSAFEKVSMNFFFSFAAESKIKRTHYFVCNCVIYTVMLVVIAYRVRSDGVTWEQLSVNN